MLESKPGYHREAYLFLREALEYTQHHKKERAEIRHVTGRELLDGVRDYALKLFGPMALNVLNEWGVQTCEDIGRIVFNMVDHNLLRKNEQDSFEDFKGGYVFEQAFREPYLPANPRKSLEPEKKPADLDYTST